MLPSVRLSLSETYRLIAFLLEEGFIYLDWTISRRDAPDAMEVMSGLRKRGGPVLLHGFGKLCYTPPNMEEEGYFSLWSYHFAGLDIAPYLAAIGRDPTIYC